MKLSPLDPVREEQIGRSDAVVQISHVGLGRHGLPMARLTVWNGKSLEADVITPDRATDRRRLARAAAAAEPSLTEDDIAAALLRCANAIPALIAEMPAENDGETARLTAHFPGLVDIVADDDGIAMFLVVDPEAEHGVAVVSSHTPETGPDTGVVLTPPPVDALPWKLPRASQVLRWLAPGTDQPAQLFADVVATIKRHALLPTPLAEHLNGYYELCAAWEFHTHYLEPAAYSAELAFCAVPERGKSRLGRTLIYMARRGVHTETLREANLFRDSQDRGATLFLDCRDLWRKAEKLGCEDILLQRFERGAKVGRVLYPEKGPFADTVYYSIFGSTILASNEQLGRILDTRCIPIKMPLASDRVEYPVPDEAKLLPLRERLVAWRARQLIAQWQPVPMPKPAASRLGDVLLPLAQIVAHVAPERLASFRALAKHLETERRGERSLSWEASVVTAIAELRDQAHNGLLLIEGIAERVNGGRSEKEQLTNRRISSILTGLGLSTRKSGGNKAALVWDDAKIEVLIAHYAQPEDEPEGGEDTTGPVLQDDEVAGAQEVGPARAANANHANHAHSPAPPPGREPVAASVVSMVSVAGGRGSTNYCEPADSNANPRLCPSTDQPDPAIPLATSTEQTGSGSPGPDATAETELDQQATLLPPAHTDGTDSPAAGTGPQDFPPTRSADANHANHARTGQGDQVLTDEFRAALAAPCTRCPPEVAAVIRWTGDEADEWDHRQWRCSHDATHVHRWRDATAVGFAGEHVA